MIVCEFVALSYSIIITYVTSSVAPAIAPAVTPLLLLGLILVVATIGRIRVTVLIGDCQACVFSSSEECLTSLKTVKME